MFDNSPLPRNSSINAFSASSTLSSVRTRFVRIEAQELAGRVVGNHDRSQAGLSETSASLKLGSGAVNLTGVFAYCASGPNSSWGATGHKATAAGFPEAMQSRSWAEATSPNWSVRYSGDL